MNINIKDYIPTHKYIRLYENEDDYNEDVNNHVIEECAYSLVNKNNNEIEQNYQPSHRITNNDNNVIFSYFNKDKINIWAGLNIIWGYFGFQKTNYEYNEENLIGGNFVFTKPMTVVKEVPDAYTLEHLNNFLLYAPNNSITEIQYFDTSNIKSASYVFYNITVDCKINNDVLKNWSNLKIINAFAQRINIYNSLNDNDIIDFSSLESGFDNFIYQFNYTATNIYKVNSYQFTKLIKFKFGNLQDTTFYDFISYSIIKNLYNKNILEYTFSDYVIDLNKNNCEIVHYIPIYNNFVYNFDNELNGGLKLYLFTDSEHEDTVCNVTFNVSNCGKQLKLIGASDSENDDSHPNENNIYNININNDITFNDYSFYWLNDNNIIINKDIEFYTGNVVFSRCIINKNINASGKIVHTTVNGNVDGNILLYHSTVNGNVDTSELGCYNNIVKGDFYVNAQNISYDSNANHNNKISGKYIINITGRLYTFRNNTCDILEYKSGNINLQNWTINSFLCSSINIDNSNITFDNCIFNNDIIINNESVIDQFNLININKKITINKVRYLNIKDSNCDIIVNAYDTSNRLYSPEINISNSIISINDINLELARPKYIKINLANTFTTNNANHIINNISDGYYINTCNITYNKEEYDVSEIKVINNTINVSYITINSNIAIYDVVGLTIHASLNNQDHINIHLNNFDNKLISVTLDSESIETITIYIKDIYWGNVNENKNIYHTFNFTNCINIVNLYLDENIKSNTNYANTKFDFTNCLNINENVLYDFLHTFMNNYNGYHQLIIENEVYKKFTEEQISNLLQHYTINVIHQD